MSTTIPISPREAVRSTRSSASPPMSRRRPQRPIGSRPSSWTARLRCRHRSRSSTRPNALPLPRSWNSSTAPTSRSFAAPRRPPASTPQRTGWRGRAPRPRRRRCAPSTACGPTAAPRWAHGSRTSAESSGSARARSFTRSCSPTARTSTRPQKNWGRKSGSVKANSPATAEEWEPTGRSTNCVRSRPHCWAPWTSSPTPRISQTISHR